MLSLCSRSCLHSALIDEVVATFTLTVIEVRGKKTIKPFYRRFFLHIHSRVISSLLQYVLSVPLSSPYFFPLSVKFNELLCWHDSSVFMCLRAASFCPHYFALSAIVPPFFYTLFRVFFSPIGLSRSCQISGLSVHNTILTVHTLYISLVLSLALWLLLSFKGTHSTACDI